MRHLRIGIGDIGIDLEIVVVDDGGDAFSDLRAARLDGAADARDVFEAPHLQMVQIQEQQRAPGVVVDALFEIALQKALAQIDLRLHEQAGRHGHRRRIHQWREFHLRQDVALDIDARRDFSQAQPARRQFEDAALGDVEHRLPQRGRAPAGEGDLLDLGAEFSRAPFAQDVQAAIERLDRQAARGEGAGQQQLFRVLRDIDEAARARQLRAEAADIDIARRIAFGHTEHGQVQPAAIVEIELLVLIDDGFDIRRRAEIQAAGRHAADDAGFGGQRDQVEHALFVGHRRNALGHADAQVDHAFERQLHCAASRDDLALVQTQGLERIQRYLDLACESRRVGGGIGLAMVLGLGHHHAIDERAGHLHQARVQRAGLGDALNLRDHDAARIARGHRHRQVVQRERFALHGDIAVGIGGGAADEGHIDGKSLVEEPLLAVDLHHADDVLGGRRIDLATVQARIDEGAQADLGQEPRLARSDIAVQVRDAALRQVVGLDAVLDRQFAELGDQAPVAADRALQQTFLHQAVQATLLAIALPRGEDQRQVARLAAFLEARGQRGQQFIRRADADEARGRQRIAGPDEGHRIDGGDDLVAHDDSKRNAVA